MQRRRRTKDKHVSYSILPVANLNASTDAEQAPLMFAIPRYHCPAHFLNLLT